MNFTTYLQKDKWLALKYRNNKICYNPSIGNFLYYKKGFYQNIIGINNDNLILEKLVNYKSIISRNEKIKTLIILPNKAYCNFFENNLKKKQFAEHFDFIFKHKVELTLEHKKSQAIFKEHFDLMVVKEDITLEWLTKKRYQFNAEYSIYIHNMILEDHVYEFLIEGKFTDISTLFPFNHKYFSNSLRK